MSVKYTDRVPIGYVHVISKNDPVPDGWAVCDGREVELRLPDLRHVPSMSRPDLTVEEAGEVCIMKVKEG